MDEQQRDMDQATRERACWLHDVRNAVNTAGVAVALSKRLMRRGDTACAMEMLDMASESWERCRALLVRSSAQGASSQDDADQLLRLRDGAERAQPAPPTRR
jgi:hypothetical protein